MKAVNPQDWSWCRELLAAVSFRPGDYGCLLRKDWATGMGCEIVASESAGRIPDPAIPRLSRALGSAGYDHCVAIPSEDLGSGVMPLELEVCEHDFRELNSVYGLYEFVITVPERSWAISCNVWFNLFGAPPKLLGEILGMPLDRARQEFGEFARLVGGSIPGVGEMYAARPGDPLGGP